MSNTWGTIVPCRFSRRAHSRFPGRPAAEPPACWRAAWPAVVGAQATTRAAPPRGPSGRRLRAEQAELIFLPQAEKDHEAQRSGPRLWKRSFCASRQDKNKTVSLLRSPAPRSPLPVSLASPGQRLRRLRPGRSRPRRSWSPPRPPSFQQAPPSKERGPSAPARSPPAKPQTPSDFAFRRRSVRSRCTRSAKTWRVTPRRTAMSPYCQPSTIRHSSSLRSSACRSRRRARS